MSSVILNVPDWVELPVICTTPEPFGDKGILPFDTETIEFPLTSKSPPSWGDVSSTTSPPVWTSKISGLVPSFAVAKTIAVPLFVVAKVKVPPDPVAYLNCTV